MKKIRHTIIAALTLSLCSLLPLNVAQATEPCPPRPCADANSCAAQASWIADGIVTNISNDKQGHPLNKNLASFTLRIDRWIEEPENMETSRKLKFKVGWCTNVQELPDDLNGVFRFYGGPQIILDPDNPKLSYLYFEKLPTSSHALPDK